MEGKENRKKRTWSPFIPHAAPFPLSVNTQGPHALDYARASHITSDNKRHLYRPAPSTSRVIAKAFILIGDNLRNVEYFLTKYFWRNEHRLSKAPDKMRMISIATAYTDLPGIHLREVG